MGLDPKGHMLGVLVFSGRSFGGVERRFARLAAHLHGIGHPVRLYVTADGRSVMRRLRIDMLDDAVTTIDAPSTGRRVTDKLNRLRGLQRLFGRLRADGITHLHLAMNPGMVPALYSLRRDGPPYSVSMVDTTYAARHHVLEELWFRLTLRGTRAVDCLSETLRAELADRFGDDPRFKAAPCSFTDYSAVRSVPRRDIDVATIARFTEGKGHDLLRAACGVLPPMVVHVCGSGPLDPEVTGAVTYETDDPFAVLARTKIFVSLQRYENYPSQSLLEAMASGCAIIATDVGETRRLLDESCAVLIPPVAGDLAEAIRDLLDDPVRREALGAAARERVLRHHTVERFTAYFLSEIVS